MNDINELLHRLAVLEQERDDLSDLLADMTEQRDEVQSKLAALTEVAKTSLDLARATVEAIEKGDF